MTRFDCKKMRKRIYKEEHELTFWHPVYACIYRNVARFQLMKPQRIAFSAIRKIPNEIVPHCVKVHVGQRNCC